MFSIPSSPNSPFVDLAVVQTVDGFFDLAANPGDKSRDAQVTDGLNSALIVSFFSDRRARSDEVADPLKRRGWIGDLVSDIPGDRLGSGLWLYEQRRLIAATAAGVAAEAANAVQWMADSGLCTGVAVDIVSSPATRALSLLATITLLDGNVSNHAFALAAATTQQQISV